MNKEAIRFILRWISVTTIGSALGLAVAFGLESDRGYRPLFLFLGFVISGALSGFGQWLILRKKTRKTVWGWIPANTLGIPLGLFIGFWVNELLIPFLVNHYWFWSTFLVMSITAGLFTGILQWLVLFRSFPSPIWLLLSSVSLIGISIFYPHPDNPIYFFEPLNKILLGLIFGGLIGLLLGIVSGVNIARAISQNEDS
jgi:hypothetical protein